MTEREPVQSSRSPKTPATQKASAVGAARTQAREGVRGLTYEEGRKALSPATADATVVALDWSAGLGAAPLTRVMPDMRRTPVDARFAMAAVPVLPGWGKPPAGDQDRLNALLGGETNAVSATTRDYLRPKYLDLKSRPEAEQEAALSATIGHQEATPRS